MPCISSHSQFPGRRNFTLCSGKNFGFAQNKLIMRKYFFSFLFLLLSSCSSDLKSDKSSQPFSPQLASKSFYQKKKSDLVKEQKTETGTDAGVNAGVGVSANVSASSNADVGTSTDVSAGLNTDVDISTNAGADTDTGKRKLGEVHSVTAQQEEINPDADSSLSADNIAQKPADKAIQEQANFDVEDNLIQEEICEGFSKTDWINQGLSIKQSIQHFATKQMESLLGINKVFPSPQDKEDSIRCFVNTAFSLNNIFKIVTDHWWQNVQVSLQAPHKETLMGFIEHYFTAWIGYGLLLPIKSIPSGRIHFVMEEPHLLKDKQYKVVINFNVMNLYSAEIAWIVDAQSFPNELVFLDIFVEGVSILYLLRNQMDYLFQKRNGDMNEIVFDLQKKMDDSSFAHL